MPAWAYSAELYRLPKATLTVSRPYRCPLASVMKSCAELRLVTPAAVTTSSMGSSWPALTRRRTRSGVVWIMSPSILPDCSCTTMRFVKSSKVQPASSMRTSFCDWWKRSMTKRRVASAWLPPEPAQHLLVDFSAARWGDGLSKADGRQGASERQSARDSSGALEQAASRQGWVDRSAMRG